MWGWSCFGELERTGQEPTLISFKVLSPNLPGLTEKNHWHPQSRHLIQWSIFELRFSRIQNNLFTSSVPLTLYGVVVVFFYHFTDGRTPWTSDQLVARSLPKHRTTQTKIKHIRIPNIHALCGIRFRASEDSICLRPAYKITPSHIIQHCE
jgi:hypothetical protein